VSWPLITALPGGLAREELKGPSYMDKMNEADFVERERRLREAANIVPCEALPPVKPKAERVPMEFPVIPLSDEQRSILEQPVDPRVARILGEIGEERRIRAGMTDSRRIVRFPFVGSAPGHAIRDADGHWTIVSGPPPDLPLSGTM
jgi:hypothetical protein